MIHPLQYSKCIVVTCKKHCFSPVNLNANDKELHWNARIYTKYFNIFIACIYNLGFKSLQTESFFSSPKCPVCPFGPSSFLFNGTPAVRQQGRDTNHSPLSSTQNDWSYPSLLPLYVFMLCTGMTLPIICCTYGTTV